MSGEEGDGDDDSDGDGDGDSIPPKNAFIFILFLFGQSFSDGYEDTILSSRMRIKSSPSMRILRPPPLIFTQARLTS